MSESVARRQHLLAVLLLVFSGCRAGGDLKNEEHYAAVEQAEIAAEKATSNPSPSPSASVGPTGSSSSTGVPAALALTGPASVTAGACGGPYTLALLDAQGASATATSGTYQILLSDTHGGQFFASSGCSSATSTFSIYKKASSTLFYYRSTAAGQAALSASESTLTSATLGPTVSAGSVSSISLGLAKTSATVGECLALPYAYYDSYSNAGALTAARTVGLQTSDPIGLFYAASGCTGSAVSGGSDAVGATSNSTLYYKPKTAGAFTLVASSDSLASGTITGSATAATGSWFQWSGADSVTAGACSTFTLSVVDEFGNSTTTSTATTVSVSSTSGTLYGDSLCSSARTSLSLAAGRSSTVSYFNGTSAATVTLRASATGYSAATTTVVLRPGSSSALALSLTPPLRVSTCRGFTVTTRDAYANSSTQSTNQTLTLSGGGTGIYYSDAPCSTPASTLSLSAGNSSTAAYFKATTPQTTAFTVASGALSSGVQAVTIFAEEPVSVTIAGTHSPIKSECTPYTLTLKDTFGSTAYNASSAALSLTANSGSFYTSSACSVTTAAATVSAEAGGATTYYKYASDGAVTFGVGSSTIASGTFVATMTYGSAAALTLSGGSSVVFSGLCSESPYTLSLIDTYGNLVPSTGTTTATFASTSSGEIYPGRTCIDRPVLTASIPNGQSQTTFYLSGTRTESITFSAQSGALQPATATTRFATKPQVRSAVNNNCYAMASGNVKCLGNTTNGVALTNIGANVGADITHMGSNLNAARLGINRTVLQLAGSYDNGSGGYCAILDDHKLKCWGDGDNTSLGHETTAITGNTAATWGDNLPYVNLGTNRLAYRVTGAYAGFCVITDTGGVKCWGFADTTDYAWSAGYGDNLIRGKTAGTMGDYLPDVNLGSGVVAADITCAKAHCCATTNDNRLKCWGYGANGRLGYGDSLYRGLGTNNMGDYLPYVNLGTNRSVKSAAAIITATCAILDTNQMKCFGYGALHFLASGGTGDLSDSPSEVGDNLAVANLGSNRTVLQIVNRDTGNTANSGLCALLDDGGVKCWGTGYYQGNGDNITRGGSASTIGNCLPYVDVGTNRTTQFLLGNYANTCAVLDNGQTKCWGAGGAGRMGYGDSMPRGYTAGQMGDCFPAIDFGEAMW